jgi:hypothetical protein
MLRLQHFNLCGFTLWNPPHPLPESAYKPTGRIKINIHPICYLHSFCTNNCAINEYTYRSLFELLQQFFLHFTQFPNSCSFYLKLYTPNCYKQNFFMVMTLFNVVTFIGLFSLINACNSWKCLHFSCQCESLFSASPNPSHGFCL